LGSGSGANLGAIFTESTGFLGLGTTASVKLELREDELLSGGVTDGFSAAGRLVPEYSGAFTVTRHNYFDIEDVLESSGATVTDAALFRFNAALGTHKATTASDKTGNTASGTIIVNINGTLFDIQLYAH